MSKKHRSDKTVEAHIEAANHDQSPYVYKKKPKISFDLSINSLPWTENQKKFIDLALDKKTRVIILKGVAGTAKTTLAVYIALQKLQQKKASEIYYTRVPVEASKYGIGFIKGDQHVKMAPYLEPCLDKLRELLPQQQITALLHDERVIALPVGFLRGLNLAGAVIFDEAQNADINTLLLVMSRMAKFSFLCITGDSDQIDVKDSGFNKVYDAFNNDTAKNFGIHTVSFGVEDIVRSEILAYIINTFQDIRSHK